MERYGNLDLTSWYEIRELEGKNYPDRLKYENGSISFTVEADRYTVFLFHAERKPECKRRFEKYPVLGLGRTAVYDGRNISWLCSQ